MSGAVLALSPELAVFGSSMARGCIGFLFHNRYKASVVGSNRVNGTRRSTRCYGFLFWNVFSSPRCYWPFCCWINFNSISGHFLGLLEFYAGWLIFVIVMLGLSIIILTKFVQSYS